jgi:putative ABC transport system permease protein
VNTPPEPRSVRAAIALYRAAAVMLPAAFRARYGDELIACFTGIAGEARATRGRVALWWVTVGAIADLSGRAIAHRIKSLPDGLRGAGLWQGAWLDVRHAARRLARRPAFAVTSAITLGLGLAAAAAVFSLVHGVVLRPLPYSDSDRIVEVDHAGDGIGASQGGLGITYGFYRFYAEHLRTPQAIALYSTLEQTLVGAGDPIRLNGVRATPSLVDVLRVPPGIGRWFSPAEGQPGAALTVVLSDRLWRERFGAESSVVGRVIDLGGVSREVVGVMPGGFAFPSADAAFWIPRVVPSSGIGGWNERAIARLPPGVDPPMVEREILSLYPAIRELSDSAPVIREYLDDARISPMIVPLKERVIGDVRITLWILLGTVGFVLLVAVANVANLFLVRAGESRRELTVRSALGASTGRLLRTSMAESLLIALAAGGLAMAGTTAAIRGLLLAAPANVPRLEEVGLTPAVGVVLLGLTLSAGVLLGLMPVVGGGPRFGSDRALRESGRWTTTGRVARRGRDLLMASQVALALVLLIGSGLLFRSYQTLRAVDLGFTERQALVFEVGLPESRYPGRAEAKAFHDRLLERLAGLPGVSAAGAVGRCLPLRGNMCWGVVLDVEGRPAPPGQLPPVTGARIVAGDYFRAIGIATRGRTFTPADERGDATAAILSQAAADAYFPGEDPIGRRVRFDPDAERWHTVVGVAANVRSRIETDEYLRTIYLPVLPEGDDGPPPVLMSYVVSTSVPATSIVPAVRSAVAEQDEAIPLASLGTLQALVDRATAPAAFAMMIVGLAAAVALLLGIVGVYAVVSYAVTKRTREIGVRLALGARPGDVRHMVIRQGGVVVIGGAAAGLAAAIGLTRFMQAILHGVSATDPWSFAALTALLLVVAAFALWLPARRASRVNPIDALRVE